MLSGERTLKRSNREGLSLNNLWTALWITPITEIQHPGDWNNNGNGWPDILKTASFTPLKMDFRYYFPSAIIVRWLWIS